MNQPNILLIILDAVRADHVSWYGHNRQTTPVLDNLSENGAVFENAFANSNWTGTSHGAIFSGKLPSHSGIYAGQQSLQSVEQTLPEKLQEAGYRTFGIGGGAHLRADRGYGRGFDVFEETYRYSPSLSLLRTAVSNPSLRRQLKFSAVSGPDKKTLYKLNALKRWIAGGEKPFFGFVNWKTAHHPYNPPRPYKSQFCSELSRPRYQFMEEVFARENEYGEAQKMPGMDMERLWQLSYRYPVLAEELQPTDEEWDVIKSWYDGSIRYMDQRLGELVSFLKQRGLFDETCLVITADHGELFGEDGHEKHYYSLYEPVLHVPLVIRTPTNDHSSVNPPVSLIDLHPTILDVAGVSEHDYEYAAPLLPVRSDPYHEYVFAELGKVAPTGVKRHHPDFNGDRFASPLQVVRDDAYKLITTQNGTSELYAWRTDPGEANELSSSRLEEVKRLKNVIAESLRTLTQDPLAEDIEDPNLQQHLEDLGYL